MWRPVEGRWEESAHCEGAPSPRCSQASPAWLPPAALLGSVDRDQKLPAAQPPLLQLLIPIMAHVSSGE